MREGRCGRGREGRGKQTEKDLNILTQTETHIYSTPAANQGLRHGDSASSDVYSGDVGPEEFLVM